LTRMLDFGFWMLVHGVRAFHTDAKISARISNSSTRRGTGRLKYWFPSVRRRGHSERPGDYTDVGCWILDVGWLASCVSRGCKVSARISNDSTRRGPGRL